jgi:large subunit ribosomal protein L17
MRHRRRSRTLGRSPSHRKAMFKNLATALFLTERNAEFDANAPKVKGRVITTIEKAKEVRSLVERCITLAKRSFVHKEAADKLNTSEKRHSDGWKTWRTGNGWKQWVQAIAPYLAARRKVVQLLGDKQAAKLCFEEVAPRFVTRPGGYTRVLRLAKPRLGDAGTRAILEFVGVNDRKVKKSEKPSFSNDSASN